VKRPDPPLFKSGWLGKAGLPAKRLGHPVMTAFQTFPCPGTMKSFAEKEMLKSFTSALIRAKYLSPG